jgi:branched-chain amino acid transport system permease protein
VLVLSALYVVLAHTWAGRAIRASAQNPSGAALVGVGATSTAALAFALGTSTAGVGGSVLSVLYPFFPASHYDWISRLLGIIVLGGMGSLPGALAGALVLGLAETLTATYWSLRWSTLVFYLVILVVLLFRPQGIFGTRLREDVVA